MQYLIKPTVEQWCDHTTSIIVENLYRGKFSPSQCSVCGKTSADLFSCTRDWAKLNSTKYAYKMASRTWMNL